MRKLKYLVHKGKLWTISDIDKNKIVTIRPLFKKKELSAQEIINLS